MSDLAALQQQVSDLAAAVAMLVSTNQQAHQAHIQTQMQLESRVAADGRLYTWAQFEQHYGDGAVEFWHKAKPVDKPNDKDNKAAKEKAAGSGDFQPVLSKAQRKKEKAQRATPGLTRGNQPRSIGRLVQDNWDTPVVESHELDRGKAGVALTSMAEAAGLIRRGVTSPKALAFVTEHELKGRAEENPIRGAAVEFLVEFELEDGKSGRGRLVRHQGWLYQLGDVEVLRRRPPLHGGLVHTRNEELWVTVLKEQAGQDGWSQCVKRPKAYVRDYLLEVLQLRQTGGETRSWLVDMRALRPTEDGPMGPHIDVCIRVTGSALANSILTNSGKGKRGVFVRRVWREENEKEAANIKMLPVSTKSASAAFEKCAGVSGFGGLYFNRRGELVARFEKKALASAQMALDTILTDHAKGINPSEQERGLRFQVEGFPLTTTSIDAEQTLQGLNWDCKVVDSFVRHWRRSIIVRAATQPPNGATEAEVDGFLLTITSKMKPQTTTPRQRRSGRRSSRRSSAGASRPNARRRGQPRPRRRGCSRAAGPASRRKTRNARRRRSSSPSSTASTPARRARSRAR